MMKNFTALSVLLAACCLSASLSVSQELPSLPEDPAVSHGTLPDGVDYYIASNPTGNGYADFSLVWRLGSLPQEDSLSVPGPGKVSLSVHEAQDIARDVLAGTSLFSGRTPEKFLRGNGIQGPSCGYVETRDNAVVLRFSDINVSSSSRTVDSLLLMIFDMVKTYSCKAGEMGAADCGQAVVVAGDVDKDVLLSKMELISMFVPHINSSRPSTNYSWYPGDSLACFSLHDPSAKATTVIAEYSQARVPDKYMGSVLPVVSSQMGSELGMILKRRVVKSLMTSGIPVSDVSYSFSGSSQWSGDEKYTLSVQTSGDFTDEVVQALSSALSRLSASGVTLEEYAEARRVVGRQLKRRADAFVKSNRKYTDRCISSYLYGSSLASSSEQYNFFDASGLADSSGLRFFNRFAMSLTGSTENLSLMCISDKDTVPESRLRDVFSRAWVAPSTAADAYAVDIADTSLFDAAPQKCRITSIRTDAMSGGQLWKFSNGMRILYKNIPAGGKFWYSLALKGGFSSVPGLRPGQGAFFSDMLDLYDVCGMPWDNFRYLLSLKDISMENEVGASDMSIYGSAPSGSLWFLLKALSGLASDSSPDREAFQYYTACEKLRLATASEQMEGRIAAIDSILSSGHRYSSMKSVDGLTPDLQDIAHRYFQRQFSKLNDGILILVGDLDEIELKKQLPSLMGDFTVTRKIQPLRRQSFQPVSGGSTYIVDGGSRSLDVAMSAPVQLTSETYFAAQIASMVLKDAVTPSVDGMAARVRVYGSVVSTPSERLNVVISAEECDTSRFSTGTAVLKPVKVLFSVRSILADLSQTGIPQEKLDAYKAILKEQITADQAYPDYWLRILTQRMTYGKDLHTDYQEKIDGVTAEKVRDIISSLDNGAKVEYIIRPRIRK